MIRDDLSPRPGPPPLERRRRRSRWAGAAIAATSVLALAGSACTDDSGATASPSAPGGATTTGIGWEPCGVRLECATVAVPIDWGDPDGETLDLALIKHPASDPARRIGTILTDPGGPGDTGVGFVEGAGDELDAWGDGRFDWIGWDPRGTYASSPVDCFGSEEDAARFWAGAQIPETVEQSEAFAARATELARRCGEEMGPLLSHISTTDTVRDMDRIRELLGEEEITYVGFSYGTVIGQVYANLFPDRLRAMMLDGIVDPVAYTTDAETRAINFAVGSQGVFEQFLARCEDAGADRCALAGHGETAAQRVEGLFARAMEAPLPVPGAAPGTVVTHTDLQLAAFAPLRDPTLWPAYAEDLEAAVTGDPSALSEAAAAAKAPQAWAEATKSAAISCLDGPASEPVSAWPTVIGDLTGLSPITGAVGGWWLWAPCAAGWPASSVDRYTGPWNTETEVPILLIGTRHDPNTAYQNAVRSQHRLGNAVLLTHDGYGHLSFKDRSQCVEDARVRYLVDLETPAPGTVCQADQVPFE